MDLEAVEFERIPEDDRRALYAVRVECTAHDWPEKVAVEPYEGWVAAVQMSMLSFAPPHFVLARDNGRVVGSATVRLSDQPENAHVAIYGSSVRPGHRRQGIGTALLRAALPLLRGRTVIETRRVDHGTGGEHFAAKLGFRTSITWTVQRLACADRPRPDEVPAGYRLVTWTGPVPDEFLGHYVEGLNAMVDAPSDDLAVDTLNRTPQSVRLEEADHLGSGGDLWVVLALHGDEVAGLTELRRFRGEPDTAFQWDTVVTRAHRGRGLGRVVKTHMLQQLPPEVVRVETQTNSTNEHMRRVNHSLGYVDVYTYSSINARVADLRL
ncbi:GNAT family N-acetyltransferase [Nocardia sp. NRRL S-836]|uniref:GNAT family N-acetyltransferase n=1 Tax=Nocardia sp. NRRL S-836 TaxID=1519492 RepID=UPI0006AE3599|nr:GNAT family N-acetyltransferase [Nocardia sp. NRRL S-836]KOV81980.1 hypothetical protein ADL03_26725 [Nocardia sp. NRRL S-836]